MNESILIVDDEVHLAKSCAQILKRAGFTCLVAHDSPTAISLFDSRQPALVISDVNLGNGNGFEVAEHVLRKSPTTLVLLTTGSENALKQDLPAGVAGYLRKPFSIA